MSKPHTDRTFEGELNDLRNRLRAMGSHVETMLDDAVRAFHDGDAEIARATILADQWMNSAEIALDEACLQILARRQPVASDLRFIILALKMVTDLERVGDLSTTICRHAIDIGPAGERTGSAGIDAAAGIVRNMLDDALAALLESDAQKARSVVDRDDQVNKLCRSVFDEVLAEMQRDPSAIEPGTRMHAVARSVERMGDHAKNLAEYVILMVGGTDVRHAGKRVD